MKSRFDNVKLSLRGKFHVLSDTTNIKIEDIDDIFYRYVQETTEFCIYDLLKYSLIDATYTKPNVYSEIINEK